MKLTLKLDIISKYGADLASTGFISIIKLHPCSTKYYRNLDKHIENSTYNYMDDYSTGEQVNLKYFKGKKEILIKGVHQYWGE